MDMRKSRYKGKKDEGKAREGGASVQQAGDGGMGWGRENARAIQQSSHQGGRGTEEKP